MNAFTQPILVLGIGNILLRDEGVGVRAIEVLADRALPAEIELLDGGTAGADLVDAIAGRKKVLVVDAMDAGEKPGTVYRFTEKDLLEGEAGALSLHEFGLLETLQMARELKCAPEEVIIFGVQPKSISPGLELTAEISAALPGVIEVVLAELGLNVG